MRYAGDRLIGAGIGGNFDTSNLAGKMGMPVGGEVASARLNYDNDTGKFTSVTFLNDNKPDVIAVDSRGVERKVGSLETMRNPVEEDPWHEKLRRGWEDAAIRDADPSGYNRYRGRDGNFTGKGETPDGTLYEDIPVNPRRGTAVEIVEDRNDSILNKYRR